MRCFALLLVVFWPAFVLATEVPRQVVVAATGTVQAMPDMATLMLGVSRQAPTASEAMDAASVAAQGVVDLIFETGIEAKDVQTASLNLNPVWDQRNAQPRQVIGYEASTVLTVRVRDLSLLGALLDRVVSDGANRLNGLTFGIADTAPLEQAARADAVTQAREKAETLATAAGVTLGPVQTIAEGSNAGMPAPMMRGAMMEASAMPVAAGELDVRVSVTVVYAITE
ncbi:MAG: SIMPL domain-containing protein [Pseudomonadota bacterium]